MKVAKVCSLFGHCRQAFYQSKANIEAEVERDKTIVSNVQEIREEDPRIGAYKLWIMLMAVYGSDFMPGRDSFFRILRQHHLMLPPPKARHTTNSNHRYHKYKNLTKGVEPMAPNMLWVGDITYIPLAGGDVCYLHLITDAYSHKILGWELAGSLRASVTIDALNQALDQAFANCGSKDLSGLIHHSDRGVQYCCDAYVNTLKGYNISISMTEDYKPTDNAIAERVNGIIKTECVYPNKQFASIEEARSAIGRFIDFYNNRRPHMSIGYKVPSGVHLESGLQEKRWKKKAYPPKGVIEEKDVILQNPKAGQCESVCQSL